MKKTPLRKVSDKQKKRLAEYRKARLAYMKEHPLCQVCGKLATQIHHKRGRGIRTADARYFLAVCNDCHREIHDYPVWARRCGYLE